MHLIEIFLPLTDNDGTPFPVAAHKSVERELTDRFGGVTAYPRAPASGLWKVSATERHHDDLVVYEVIVRDLDTSWWAEYRHKLERAFRQERLIVRAHVVQLL